MLGALSCLPHSLPCACCQIICVDDGSSVTWSASPAVPASYGVVPAEKMLHNCGACGNAPVQCLTQARAHVTLLCRACHLAMRLQPTSCLGPCSKLPPLDCPSASQLLPASPHQQHQLLQLRAHQALHHRSLLLRVLPQRPPEGGTLPWLGAGTNDVCVLVAHDHALAVGSRHGLCNQTCPVRRRAVLYGRVVMLSNVGVG